MQKAAKMGKQLRETRMEHQVGVKGTSYSGREAMEHATEIAEITLSACQPLKLHAPQAAKLP